MVESLTPWDDEQRTRIEDAIVRTIPTGNGGRNNGVFRLARALKAIPGVAESPAKRLRPIIVEWHQRALPVIGTKDLATTLGDFAHAWNRVRIAEGQGALPLALEAAEQAPPPQWAADYSPPCKLLASLCRELQRRAGAEPFYLSCASAVKCVGVDKGTAHRWLAAFVDVDGAMIVVAKGSPKAQRATRYRYGASDLNDDKCQGTTTGVHYEHGELDRGDSAGSGDERPHPVQDRKGIGRVGGPALPAGER